MRSILAHHAGAPAAELSFQTTTYGKPFLDSAFNTHFNLSHSGELAILAVGPRELGADVELVRPLEDLESVAHGFFSPREVADLHRYTPEERLRAFYRCWTRKEAYVKAIGEGLSIPLHSFVVSLSEHDAGLLETGQASGTTAWTMSTLDLGPDYVGAVAIAGPAGIVQTRWWGKCELVISP
jgi:4'-phosphopantetheinyl transferase